MYRPIVFTFLVLTSLCPLAMTATLAAFINNTLNAFHDTVQAYAPQVPLDLNLQGMATTAMNPLLSNNTLMQLYHNAAQIMNMTHADSVLLRLDPMDADVQRRNVLNSTIMLLAVNNTMANETTTLLDRFRLYFVNMTNLDGVDSLGNSGPVPVDQSTAVNDEDQSSSSSLSNAPSFSSDFPSSALSTDGLWDVFNNFLKNQANAIVSTFMMPVNVGLHAMQHSVQEHQQAVIAGSAYGARIAAPIILKAVALPTVLDRTVLNVTNSAIDRVQNITNNTEQLAYATVDLANQAVSTAANATVHFIVRPVAAFTGFNLRLIGSSLAGVGHGVSQTGNTIHLAGHGLNSGAVTAVSAGATAIAWAMDDMTV